MHPDAALPLTDPRYLRMYEPDAHDISAGSPEPVRPHSALAGALLQRSRAQLPDGGDENAHRALLDLDGEDGGGFIDDAPADGQMGDTAVQPPAWLQQEDDGAHQPAESAHDEDGARSRRGCCHADACHHSCA